MKVANQCLFLVVAFLVRLLFLVVALLVRLLLLVVAFLIRLRILALLVVVRLRILALLRVNPTIQLLDGARFASGLLLFARRVSNGLLPGHPGFGS
jgi:hypothetical protein